MPEPDRPVNTTSLSRGMTRSTFFRLCSRAPRTEITLPSRTSLSSALRSKSCSNSASAERTGSVFVLGLRAMISLLRRLRDGAAVAVTLQNARRFGPAPTRAGFFLPAIPDRPEIASRGSDCDRFARIKSPQAFACKRASGLLGTYQERTIGSIVALQVSNCGKRRLDTQGGAHRRVRAFRVDGIWGAHWRGPLRDFRRATCLAA